MEKFTEVLKWLAKLQPFHHLNVQLLLENDTIRVFPKMVVPLNHPILIGFSIINHPFWGIPIFGNTHKVLDIHTL